MTSKIIELTSRFASIGLTLALVSLASAALSWFISRQRIPTSYRIAVLGFPRAGKTTLITAVFAYLFKAGLRGVSIVPRGDETIQKINADMEQLELGQPLKPTTDQEVFAYRAEVRPRSGVFTRNYKLEIGDFPGEDTVAFAEVYGDWLHKTKYFQWAVDSDAFMFIVDTTLVVSSDGTEYVARQKRAFRAAWQRLQEHYLDGSRDLSRRPLLLVFAKADALWGMPIDPDSHKVQYGVEESAAKFKLQEISDQFSDLIAYFKHESRRFSTILTSVVLKDKSGERLGIPQVARAIMPVGIGMPFDTAGNVNNRRYDPHEFDDLLSSTDRKP
jgi:GTPase SAR1 family protein